MKDFNGKNAVITGAASGIGYALAEKLAKEGMNIVLADIEQEALETAVEKISEHGVKTLGVKTDVMQKNEVEHLFNESIKAFDKVHFLCNNAGVASTVLADGIWELDDKDWEWVLDDHSSWSSHSSDPYGRAKIIDLMDAWREQSNPV